MLQTVARQTNSTFVRAQLVLFHALSDQINLTQDDRRRALDLDDRVWASWMAFMRKGSLPAVPPLPDMLCRMGQVTFNLSFVAGLSYGQTTAAFPPPRSTQ